MKYKVILKRIKVTTHLQEQTNCYIVMDEKTKETMVIDPGGDCDAILEMLKIIGGKVKYIYLTHCHGDHIGAAPELKEKAGGKILIHREDAEGLYNPDINLVGYIGMDEMALEADSRVQDNDLIHLGELEFRVIHTPGHTKGGSSLYCQEEHLLFSGDTIFKGAWGRTDLPTSDFQAEIDSITTRILILPEDTIIYPGHGRSTMVREEQPLYFNLRPSED